MMTTMLGLIAETPIHCGAGRSAGIIDLPVAREAATDYPFVAGSGLKGALRDRAQALGRIDVSDLFGRSDQAGRLLLSDARLLLLPVRCMTGTYRWITCPLVLERFRRDLGRCGLTVDLSVPPNIANDRPSARADDKAGTVLYLEEREFCVVEECPSDVHSAIGLLVRHKETQGRLKRQVVVIDNDDFAWFCRNAVPVQARNVLEIGTKRSKNLWYEESLPPDTLLYTLVSARDEGAGGAVAELFPENDPYLQVGGNETVGHGWVAVTIQKGAPREGSH